MSETTILCPAMQPLDQAELAQVDGGRADPDPTPWFSLRPEPQPTPWRYGR
jgi:hypothetical protein